MEIGSLVGGKIFLMYFLHYICWLVVEFVAYGIRGMAEDKKQLVCHPASLSVY